MCVCFSSIFGCVLTSVCLCWIGNVRVNEVIYMCVCVRVGCGVLQEVMLTDIYRKAPALLTHLHMCVCTLARRWSGQKHHLFAEGVASVRVCTRVCLQREWPAPKCPSASVSDVEISTHTLKHMCCSTPLELGQMCVRMILHIRNCCFDRSFYGPSAKSYELCDVETLTDQDQMWLRELKCLHTHTVSWEVCS